MTEIENFVYFLSADASIGQVNHMIGVAIALKKMGYRVYAVISREGYAYGFKVNMESISRLSEAIDGVIINDLKILKLIDRIKTRFTPLVRSIAPLVLLLPPTTYMKLKLDIERTVSILGMYHLTPRWLFSIFPSNVKVGMVYDVIPFELREYGLIDRREYDQLEQAIKHVVRKSDVIATSTRSTYEKLYTFLPDLPPRPNVLLPPPIRNIRLPSEERQKEILIKHNIADVKYISYLGSLEPKRLYPMLKVAEAFKRISSSSNIKLLILTCHYEEARNISRIVGDNNVIIVKCPTDSEAFTIVKHSEVFLFPSLSEGFGMPILEALSLNKPVVASNLDIFREIFGNCILYADPLSEESWYKSIKEALMLGEVKCLDLLRKYSGEKVVSNFVSEIVSFSSLT